MFEQLKQKYLASFEAKIENLEQALENQNAQALTTSVHQLAGSSGSYGFDEVANLCYEVEALSGGDTIIDEAEAKTRQLIMVMKSLKIES